MAPEPQVPNPMYQALSELATQIEGDQDTMANALKSTLSSMNGGLVWYGSAADSWSSQLSGYSGNLSTNVGTAVNEVKTALASTPKTCTQSEAKMYDWVLSGRLS